MPPINFKKNVLPHLAAVGIFYIITLLFFNPVFFENKKISQYDIRQWQGGAQELREYREETGKEGLWTNSMFGGMPGYLIDVRWGNYPIRITHQVLSLGLPHPVNLMFISFVCFYILLLVFKVNPYLSIAGALAFGLSSFMIIGFSAGHNARIGAIAYMPLVIAGVHLAYRKNLLLGSVVTALALALQLRINHLQITYYTLLIILVYGLVFLYYAFREKEIADFLKRSAILIAAGVLGVATFFGHFWATYEYSRYSIRGPSELQSTGGGEKGLSKDYAFQYSNGISEPFTLLIPNFLGGASQQKVSENSEVAELFKSSGVRGNQLRQQLRAVPTYWGDQPLAAPYYAGAIAVFFFILGIVFADRRMVIWLMIIAVFSIMLSWGSSFSSFNYFMFDHFPGYNKFRSVTFALVMTIFSINLLGFLGIQKLLESEWNTQLQKKFLVAGGSVAGFCLLMILFAGAFSFKGQVDAQIQSAAFLDALRADRLSMFRSDSFRSFVFIALAGGVLFYTLKGKINTTTSAFLIVLLTTADHWFVDRRYFSGDNFIRVRGEVFQETEADLAILENDELSYRVYNLNNPFNDARTSYYHKSLGGYHGAKMRRYQDLIESCLSPQTGEMIRSLQGGSRDLSSFGAINMLNTRYLLFGQDRSGIFRNASANGNGWFVENVQLVDTPDDELNAVCTLDTKNAAVVDGSKFAVSQSAWPEGGTITLTKYQPDYLEYTSSNPNDGLAVFSEIYYPKGWKAFIDGDPVDIKRANYVLRALEIPAGDHIIEFRFEPKAYYAGNPVMAISSYLLLLLLIGALVMEYRKMKEKNPTDSEPTETENN